jgi:glucose/mannose-6-phosphate isomerase
MAKTVRKTAQSTKAAPAKKVAAAPSKKSALSATAVGKVAGKPAPKQAAKPEPSLSKIDTQNMYNVLMRFPEQLKEALSIGEQALLWRQQATSNTYAIFGLGGSAIGGDLLRSYAAATLGAEHLNISVHRGYTVPGWINSDTNVIFSSYSGETEETLTAFEEARKRTMRGVVLTTGGTLGKRAITAGMPIVNIPPGYQPRCALAYSFFPLLMMFIRYNAFDSRAVRATNKGLKEIQTHIDEMRKVYSVPNAKNPAYALAKLLVDRIPVVYSANERMDVVNLRFRGQIQENAKHLAFGNVLPEMNHNEINGWGHPAGLTKQFHAILLRDADDYGRNKIRFDALADIIKTSVGGVTVVEGKGSTLLSRMFTSIYFGDWVSYHLALLNNEDPSPVPVIQTLKARLAKAR